MKNHRKTLCADHYLECEFYLFIKQFTLFLDVGGRRNDASCVWLTSEEAVNEQYFMGEPCATAGVLRTERMHSYKPYVIINLF